MAEKINNSSSTKEMSQQTADLQRQYQKKRDEVKERGEEDLKRLREDFSSRRQKLEKENTASINHIRATHEQRSNEVKHQGYENLKSMRTNLNDEIKKNEEQFSTQNKRQILRTQQDQERINQNIRAAEARQIKDQQVSLARIDNARDRTRENEKKAMQHASESFEKNRQLETERLSQLKVDGDKKSRELREKYDQDIGRMRERHQVAMEKARENQAREAQGFSRESQKRLTELKADNEREINHIHDKYQNEIRRETVEGKQRVQKARQENQQSAVSERDRYLNQSQKIQNEYAGRVEQLRQEGKEAIDRETQAYENKKKVMREVHDQELSKIQNEHDRERMTFQSNYQKQIATDKESYRANLKAQKQEFDRIYAKNDKFGREALENQRDNVIRELSKQRHKLVTRLDKYNGLEQDPFYGVKHLNTNLSETERSFILTAEIPQHLKKDINISVQKDRVRVSGNRSFQEDLSSDNKDHRLKTDSYQTFNEEFLLSVPVLEKKIIEKYEDGKLTLIIPKVGTQLG